MNANKRKPVEISSPLSTVLGLFAAKNDSHGQVVGQRCTVLAVPVPNICFCYLPSGSGRFRQSLPE